MINIETWFPTYIGQEILEDNKKIEKKLTPICKKIQKQNPDVKNGWVSKLYNTCHSYDICKDKEFNIINNIIYNKVDEYIKVLGGKETISYTEGWFNVYKKHDFQEFHCHPNRMLSVIYILKSSNESPRIIFERDQGLYNQGMEIDSDAMTAKVQYNSLQGNLIIFRSSLNHSVEMKQDNSERISLAYNFNLKKP
jgi:uncharacterized protein (TIGR02466 family)